MTTAYSARSEAGILVAGAERKTPSFFGTLGRAWADYLAYRETLAELRGLSNQQLADAGFSREALPRIAAEAVYGK